MIRKPKMTCYKPTPDPFDMTRPMMILPGDILTDHIDPSNLTFPSSDADWMGKDTTSSSFDFLPWDLSGNDPIFDMSEEIADGLEYPNTYTTNDNPSPMVYRGYTVKTEDALSYASPVSDGDSETWSPTHNTGSQSPAAVNIKSDTPSSSLSNHRHARMPSATTSASTSNSSSTTTTTTTTISNLQASPVAAPTETSPRSRKSSNSSSSSSLSSSSSSSHTTSRPNRSSTSTSTTVDCDPAAAMKRKKAAHNAIEKRYRTNMNAKFLALGNAIPRSGPFATQLASNKGSRKQSICQTRDSVVGGSAGPEGTQQQQNKSEILTNALSYIRELQEENTRLKGESMVLKENLLPRGNMMWRR